jgi:hypothetical protein
MSRSESPGHAFGSVRMQLAICDFSPVCVCVSVSHVVYDIDWQSSLFIKRVSLREDVDDFFHFARMPY